MFCVSCLGIWWCHDIWISEKLKFNYLMNEKSFRKLKGLSNCILSIICVWLSFCSIQIYVSLQFLLILLDFPLFVFSIVPCLFCTLNFDVILIILHSNSLNQFLIKCHPWFCSRFIKTICKTQKHAPREFLQSHGFKFH